MGIPLGAAVNAGLQTATLLLLLLGLRYGVRTHRALRGNAESAPAAERTHMNLMTGAVAVSGAGLAVWMLPNFFFGWQYGANFLGYGMGGYRSYLEAAGTALPHGYLVLVHVLLGSVVAALGVFLVVRMRWGAARALSIGNYRYVMITTWVLWFANIFIGYAIFYFFVLLGTG